MREHLDLFWTNRELDARGWNRSEVDELHLLIEIPAGPVDERFDSYFLKIGAEYYDAYPPTVLFVEPIDGLPRARANTEWWPRLNSTPGWIQLHDSYQYQENGSSYEGQLVCCSVTAEYYISGHVPTDSQLWSTGERTVAATLSRISEILAPPFYGGPSAPRH
ncbi:MAG TPA: hypothetical protein VGZ04_10680 [Acidimicrobiales bacterium]|jgi:hypothetical protein|nr:hypothetical protein [Acidimicrobiales bacterium]